MYPNGMAIGRGQVAFDWCGKLSGEGDTVTVQRYGADYVALIDARFTIIPEMNDYLIAFSPTLDVYRKHTFTDKSEAWLSCPDALTRSVAIYIFHSLVNNTPRIELPNGINCKVVPAT